MRFCETGYDKLFKHEIIYLFKWLNFIKTPNYMHKTYCSAPKQ